jgi:hypothetical protein
MPNQMMAPEAGANGASPMAEDQAETPGTDNPNSGEPMSVFIPKDAYPGDVKPGDTISLKVMDVDPDSGEIEAVCEPDQMGGRTHGSKPAYEDAIDNMPEKG